MSALTREQIFNGQPYFEEPIPPQAVDVGLEKQVAATVKVAAKSLSIGYVVTFVLMFLLKFAMQLFWGSLRILQVIFTLVLIEFR